VVHAAEYHAASGQLYEFVRTVAPSGQPAPEDPQVKQE